MKFIAILRGINVGGKRKILMQEFREQLGDLAFKKVQTYIQSGNVIFEYSGKENTDEIAEKIEKMILQKYGFEVPVIVWKSENLQKAVQENIFSRDFAMERLHLTFLQKEPSPESLENIEIFDFRPDRYIISGKKVYIYCNGKYSDTKLSNTFFENKLKVKASTRNWKTVLKLCELSKEDS